MARPEYRPLKVTELVEDEEWMVAGAPKVAVKGRAFLLAVCGAVRAVHIEHQPLEPGALMNPVDPMARDVGQGDVVFVCCQKLCLEPRHLTRRGGKPKGISMAHERPHGGVKPQALSIINIFIASEPSKNRLTEKSHDLVLNVLAQTTIGELLPRHPA